MLWNQLPLPYPKPNGMQFDDVQKQQLDAITDWPLRWQPSFAMQVRVSRRLQRSKSPMCRSPHGAGCSLFAEAKDSSIAKFRSSRKHANRSMPTLPIANI